MLSASMRGQIQLPAQSLVRMARLISWKDLWRHRPVEGPDFGQVEFTTFDGKTGAVVKVPTDQIRPLGDREIHHVRAFEPAAC